MYMLSNQPRFSWFSVVSCLFPLKRVCLVDFRCSIGEPFRDIQIDGSFLCNFHEKGWSDKIGFRTYDASKHVKHGHN